MTGLQRDEEKLAWDFRAAWIKGYPVAVVLDDRCLLQLVVGRVSYVAVTGAYAMVDGWHLPMNHVLGVNRATIEQRDAYAEEKRREALAAAEERRAALARHATGI